MLSDTPLQNAINELLTLFAGGRYAQSEQRARVLLQAFPASPIVCELLGMALAAQNRFADALPFLTQAAARGPGDPQFWENLGQCQRQLKQFAQAETSFRRVLALRPRSVVSLDALAEVLHALRRHDEAQKVADELHAIEPDYARRQQDERERLLRNAIAANPGNAEFHDQLGLILRLKGDLAGAEASFRRAIDCDPGGPRAHVNLALLLSAHRRDREALAAARAALALIGEADASHSPEQLELLALAAFVLETSRESGEAVRIYKAVQPLSNDTSLALPIVYAARKACDWAFAASLEREACAAARGYLDARRANPGHLLALACATALDQLAAAQSYARQVQGGIAARPAPPRAPRPPGPRSRRLRVSYFSRDFHSHAISILLTGVIEAHDRTRFEIIAHDYSPPAADDYRRRLEAAFERMVLIGDMSDEQATARIAADDIDVVIDIDGWTKGHRARVLAMRPASVQIQWLGHPGTMGAPWIDYIVADPVLIPPGHEAHFSEKIIRLPNSYQPNDDKRSIGEGPRRQACGLPDGAFVFCCFNQAFKITPEVFDEWMRLLDAAPGSVLWLLDTEPQAVATMRGEASARGVAPDRLIFAPGLPHAEHLARLRHADLALDCHPYGSHTTASDMLWAGVPLVALMGETFASRVSASILTAAGLPELITTSLDDHYRLALRLATDRAQLATLRSRVEVQRRGSALFDTPRFARDLESGLLAAFERHCRGLAPDHIAVG
ncbi:MAG: hypothetical protein QOG83_3634 [Alphaproteobacteria bacterium]|nr:hypothetical protein [Alphaproteobacteria bacterium]